MCQLWLTRVVHSVIFYEPGTDFNSVVCLPHSWTKHREGDEDDPTKIIFIKHITKAATLKDIGKGWENLTD